MCMEIRWKLFLENLSVRLEILRKPKMPSGWPGFVYHGTLNTDRTRDSAGRKVGLRTVAAPPRRSGRDGPPSRVRAIPTR